VLTRLGRSRSKADSSAFDGQPIGRRRPKIEIDWVTGQNTNELLFLSS
jgi:hypothetical protein